jgi:hypothetical protein
VAAVNLDRVTLTGADDSVNPMDLAKLSRRYPFVEWGILVSRSQSFQPRWPSPRWIRALQDIAAMENMALSLHVCGHWVRQLLLGEMEVPQEYLASFKRVQLNFHGEAVPYDHSLFLQALPALGKRQIIFQMDGRDGPKHLAAAWAHDPEGDLDAVPLHDASHGAGVVPGTWPQPVGSVYQGYAGGLGPHNLAAQLKQIERAAGERRVWVDMETKVRSAGDRNFDLAKAEAVLALAKHHIAGQRAQRLDPAVAWPFAGEAEAD